MNNTLINKTGKMQDVVQNNKEIVTSMYQRLSAAQEGGLENILDRPACLESFYRFYAAIVVAFPDFELNIDTMIVKGDRVMVRYTISGSHEGVFMGLAPTNKRMVITGLDIFRLVNGTVVEHWDAAHQMLAIR